MNILKPSVLIYVFALLAMPIVQAKEVTSLPSIHVMAESELREEAGIVPFQEDKAVRQALRHHIDKIQNEIQNPKVNQNPYIAIDYQPSTSPDMSQLSPFLQQYILSITSGLQSSDPASGIFNMLAPLNINRNNVDAFRDGTMKVNLEDILRLQQQIKDGLNPPQNPWFPR
ncbi:hypothetical protein [Acinetobacter guerrae]|uniref:hypothetical protein n=1 Tax=Acinetobacter guerrae TaxID=1843371 RepID=UPI00128D1761|nr:hypothetical protein [Acinetobacter guerrae]MPW45657.1 peptide signal protein [Acinetobacter guerrae]